MKYVELITDLGKIVLELDDKKAPKSTSYFCGHIESGEFEDCHFYRIVKKNPEKDALPTIDIIQGGVGWSRCGDIPSVPLETTRDTGITHKNGTISMARGKPNSATSSFFICINDQPELDFAGKRNPDGQGFAAFGQVVKGMDVVREIQKQKDEGQTLIEKIEFKVSLIK